MKISNSLLSTLIVTLILQMPLYADEAVADTEKDLSVKAETNAEPEYTDAEIAEMINNPLGSLWLLFLQNDTKYYGGDLVNTFNGGDKLRTNITVVQPVMPMQLTDNLKLIFRPVIPIISSEQPSGANIAKGIIDPNSSDWNPNTIDSHNGIGDIVLWTAFGTNESVAPPNIFGFGMTTMLPTASRDELGTGKYSAGPMGLAFRITDKWIYGVVAQHWWSFAGDSTRSDVSLTDVQYVLRYRVTNDTNIGFAPNIQYDWTAKSENALTLPVGIGADTLIKVGGLPIKIGIEYHNYIESPSLHGPDWQLRVYFVPIIPSPRWSKESLLNF